MPLENTTPKKKLSLKVLSEELGETKEALEHKVARIAKLYEDQSKVITSLEEALVANKERTDAIIGQLNEQIKRQHEVLKEAASVYGEHNERISALEQNFKDHDSIVAESMELIGEQITDLKKRQSTETPPKQQQGYPMGGVAYPPQGYQAYPMGGANHPPQHGYPPQQPPMPGQDFRQQQMQGRPTQQGNYGNPPTVLQAKSTLENMMPCLYSKLETVRSDNPLFNMNVLALTDALITNYQVFALYRGQEHPFNSNATGVGAMVTNFNFLNGLLYLAETQKEFLAKDPHLASTITHLIGKARKYTVTMSSDPSDLSKPLKDRNP